MNCFITYEFKDGSRKEIQGYPSRGWALSSAHQHADYWHAVLNKSLPEADAKQVDHTVPIPAKVLVILEKDNSIYASIPTFSNITNKSERV